MINTYIFAGFIIIFIWFIVLTFLFLRLSSHYNKLLKSTSKHTLQALLEMVLHEYDETKKGIEILNKRCDKIEEDNKKHIQNLGLLRFNPFKDTGGDQSFILSLTDSEKNGVIISGLYSRNGTRWYAKKIKNGKGVDYQLSEEEKKSLEVN